MVRYGYAEFLDLINIAVATAKIEEIKIPYSPYKIRPFMHCIICGLIGTGKSTILNKICDKTGTFPQFNLTSATLLGTVDKTTGIPTVPAVWEARNSVLGIDEFKVSKGDSNRSHLNNFLSILESPKYVRKIGYRCNDFEEKDGDLFCKIKDGKIMVNSRFVMIASTMMRLDRPQRMIELVALKSRCLIIPHYPSLSDIKDKLHGIEHYKYKEYIVKKKCVINKTKYNKIVDLVMDSKLNIEDCLRTVGDICRAYAIVKWNDEIFQKIIKIKKLTPI